MTINLCKHGVLFNDYGCALCDMDNKINGIQGSLDSHLACWNTLESKLSGMHENISMLMKFIFGHNPYEKNLANRMQEVEEKVVDIGSDAIYYMTHEEFHKRVTPRIDEIEKFTKSIKEYLNNHLDSSTRILNEHVSRICKLEEVNQKCFDNNPMGEITKRFKECEDKINSLMLENSNLKSLIEDLEEDFGTENPVKCPVCEGSGQYRLIQYDGQVDFKDCQACDGKGIVWS